MAATGGAVGDAASNIDQAKASALAALATGGTQGLAAYQAAQQATAANKQAAIQQTLKMSAGDPAGAAQELNAIGSRPFDQFAATTGALSSAFAGANALRSSAADTYFREAQAAVPIVRALTEQKLATMRQANAEKAAKEAKAAGGFGGSGFSESEIKAASIGRATQDYNAAQAEAERATKAYNDAKSQSDAGQAARLPSDPDRGMYEPSHTLNDPVAQKAQQDRLAALKAQADRASAAAYMHAQQVQSIEATPENVRQQQAASTLFPQLAPEYLGGLFPAATPQQQLGTTRAQLALDNPDASGVPRLPAVPTSAPAIRLTKPYNDGLQAARDAAQSGATFHDFVTGFLADNPHMDDATLLTILGDAKGLGFASATALPTTGPSTGP